METAAAARSTTTAMQRLLYTAGVLVFIAGFQLFVLTERTDTFFAWTIAPPKNLFLTAVFLGASYWASCVLEVMAAREAHWSRARIAVPAVLLFTTLTLIITLLNLNLFHLNPPLGQPAPPVTVFLTYFWLLIYAAVPVLMAVLLVLQVRQRSDDLPRTAPLPGWMRVALILQGAVMLVIGAGLLFFPSSAPALWPWQLTRLTSMAVGAWLVGLHIAAFQAAWENDFRRIRASTTAYAVLGILQLIGIARYPADLDWSSPKSWLYVAFLISAIGVGGYGAWKGNRLKNEFSR